MIGVAGFVLQGVLPITGKILSTEALVAACNVLVACNETPMQPVVLPTGDPAAYRLVALPMPLSPS